MEDDEIALVHGAWRAIVAPYGASLRGATHDGEPVVTGYAGKSGKVGGQGDVLIPFPGRVAGGRYLWEGRQHRLVQNDKDGPNAIHGFLRTLVWEIADLAAPHVTFQVDFPGAEGYPFPLKAAVTYTLGDDGLTCSFTIANTGDAAAPVSAGFHPYFTAGSPTIDDDTLHLPFSSVLEFERLIPTGRVRRVAEADRDFRTPRPIGDTTFNHCFVAPQRDPDGRARIALTGAAGTVTVWMDAAFDYVVLYSGDPLPESHRRRALAIEPMTCASDGFNHPHWGLVRLEPGARTTGTWGVTRTPAPDAVA
jgi:aldose 1-epimerase